MTSVAPPGTEITSDALAVVHEVLSASPRLQAAWGPVARVRLVVDANVVLGDLRWLVAKREKPAARTHLQELLISTAGVAYAPYTLKSEVAKYIPLFAQELGVAEARLWAEWQFFEERIHFVEAVPIDVGDGDLSRDPADLPYLYVAVHVGAAGIYTWDQDIPAMAEGLDVRVVDREVIIALRDYARGTAVDLTIKLSGLTLIETALILLGLTGRNLVRGLAGLSSGAKLALIGAGLFVLVHRPSRDVIVRLLRGGGASLVDAMNAILPIGVELTKQANAAGSSARASLARAETQLLLGRRDPVGVLLFAALASARKPLLVDEIERDMRALGYTSRAPTRAKYLERLLRADSRYTRDRDRRWQLRRRDVAP